MKIIMYLCSMARRFEVEEHTKWCAMIACIIPIEFDDYNIYASMGERTSLSWMKTWLKLIESCWIPLMTGVGGIISLAAGWLAGWRINIIVDASKNARRLFVRFVENIRHYLKRKIDAPA